MTKIQVKIDAEQLNRETLIPTDVTVNDVQLLIFVDNIPASRDHELAEQQSEIDKLKANLNLAVVERLSAENRLGQLEDEIQFLREGRDRVALIRDLLSALTVSGKLTQTGEVRLHTIKAMRTHSSLGLKEAVDLYDAHVWRTVPDARPAAA